MQSPPSTPDLSAAPPAASFGGSSGGSPESSPRLEPAAIVAGELDEEFRFEDAPQHERAAAPVLDDFAMVTVDQISTEPPLTHELDGASPNEPDDTALGCIPTRRTPTAIAGDAPATINPARDGVVEAVAAVAPAGAPAAPIEQGLTAPTTVPSAAPVSHTAALDASPAAPVSHATALDASPAAPASHTAALDASPAAPASHTAALDASPAAPASHTAALDASPAAPASHTAALDPSRSLDVPLTPPKPRKPRPLSPRVRVIAAATTGVGVFGVLLAIVARDSSVPGAAPAASVAPLSALRQADATPSASASASASATAHESVPIEGPWRAAQMGTDEGVKIVQGKLGQKSLTDALLDEHVPKAQVFRVLKAFEGVRHFDKPHKNDAFVVALDRASKKIRAFEYQASVTDVWQAREDDSGRLVGKKLDLHVEQRRIAKAIVVKDDLKSAVVEAGFDDDLLDALDDALDDRIALSSVHRGATLRVVAQEQTVAGKFARYVEIEALEYAPPKHGTEPTRLYHLKGGKSAGYYDTHGKTPYKGGWRYPVKFPRVTSRFNPKRMHPVLHVVKPHNGCDFGASLGTPVFAAAHGTVEQAAPRGPSGNLVVIAHGGGLETGYAHLSRFAPGLKAGDRVDTRQLIGFVGSTGRSTGPHLHFSLKKNGVFTDPLTLKLDGERVLPKSERGVFDELRRQMDSLLDAIPLPDRGDAPVDPPDETDEASDEGEAGAADAPAAPAPALPTPASPSPDDHAPVDSAVWKPH